jgi:hypothetical protein
MGNDPLAIGKWSTALGNQLETNGIGKLKRRGLTPDNELQIELKIDRQTMTVAAAWSEVRGGRNGRR